MVMTVNEFIDRLKFAASQKTVYIKGCFGAPMNATNKKRYTTNLAYNKNRASIISACSYDTFGFDCVNLIKGILWGWNGDASKPYGGATYALSGSVPDINANGLIKQCSGVSTNFNNIVRRIHRVKREFYPLGKTFFEFQHKSFACLYFL